MAEKPKPAKTAKPAKPTRRERSRAARVSNRDYPRVPGTVTFTAGAIQGKGTIFDISATGANVYMPTKSLPKGAVADLFFLQPETQRKLYAVGQVVRVEETGFAVHFLRIERELEALVLAATEDADADADAPDSDD